MKIFHKLSIISFSLLLATLSHAQSFPKPSVPDNLKDMPYERWQDTESGRFAHSLQYEDKLAKPVPYTFTEGKDYRQESIDYFEHLCKTEGKDYIYKTVTGVDTIAQLRSFEIPFDKTNNPNWGPQSYKFHPYALESPVFFDEVVSGVIDNNVRRFNNLSDLKVSSIRGFYAIPYSNYELNFNNRQIINFKMDYLKHKELEKQSTNFKKYESKEYLNKITAKYGFTWRGFSRDQDRDFGIAGGDLIVLDLVTNKIIAIQRTFIKGSIQKNSPTSLIWEGVGCFEQYKNHILHTNKDFSNKSFADKSKLINYASPSSRTSPAFIQKVIIPIN